MIRRFSFLPIESTLSHTHELIFVQVAIYIKVQLLNVGFITELCIAHLPLYAAIVYGHPIRHQ